MATTGITKAALWSAWKEVRRLLRKASRRDVTDYFEFDVDPDQWIERALRDIDSGQYEPEKPYRYSLAKNMGFSRRMTMPRIRDLVVYRAITDRVLRRIKWSPGQHVHFGRNTIAKDWKGTEDSFGYGSLSGSAFEEWMKFNQYRKHLLHDRVYPFVVLTDITNYFDTILFDRIIDAAMRSGVGSRTLGLLRFFLERLAIRDSYNESPRIGLPVDEFDCSRTLAHVVLSDHDKRMTDFAGKDAYTRWMDDQAIGVESRAAGLHTLKVCGNSLSRLHLTPNTSKTCILTLAEAEQHFHFKANESLDQIIELLHEWKGRNPKVARMMFGHFWRWDARRSEAQGGEWAKVLKRAYRVAGQIDATFLRPRATRDILKYPALAARIADYVAATGSADQYIDFAESVWFDSEQVYSDVNVAVAERLLLVEAKGPEVSRIRRIARELLHRQGRFPGSVACAALVPLLILRFGDRRSLRTLQWALASLAELHPAVGKAVAVVYASYGQAEYQEVVAAASTLRDNYLSDFLSMLDLALTWQRVPKRWLSRRSAIPDPISGNPRLDTRRLLTLRLLRLSKVTAVRQWLDSAETWMLKQNISTFDKDLVRKIFR